MTKSIHTLIQDVYEVIDNGYVGVDWDAITVKIAHEHSKEKGPARLRLSQMGDRCPKALWHSIHTPHEAEPLPPQARFKYTYGHIIEAVAIQLAKASGHDVTGEQDEIIVDGVMGHRDCVIDGAIVDVKSTSSLSFKKFKDKTIAEDDSFGYLAQLDAYVLGSINDPLVRIKDRGYIWAIDKQLGHMCLYEHYLRRNFDQYDISFRIAKAKQIVSQVSPPLCNCETESDGESGNIKLSSTSGYNAFKYCCFPRLRTFLYSGGPRYLTTVKKRPTNRFGPIPEVDRYGNYI